MYGLLQAAAVPAAGVRFVTDVDEQGRERWLDGIEVYPYPPNVATAWAPCNSGSAIQRKDFGPELDHPQFAAFAVVVGETCTSSKIWDQDQFSARAMATLEAVEGFGVEQELLSGDVIPGEPFLSDGQGTFPNGDAATKPINGLALLEQEIAKSGRLGLIHCSPMLASALMGNGFALGDKTGVIRTINGNVVIPGTGYVYGAAPNGHAAATGSEEWAYATGPIDIRRTAAFILPGRVEEALDRGTGGATNGRPNSITYRAERYYAIDWDTQVQAAVLIDRCMTTC